MKKILSGLIAFCIACSFMIPISATELPTIYYNKITGNTGDDIQVSVGIKNNTGLAGLLLRIEYNPNEVEIKNITNGTAFADAMFTTPDMSGSLNSPFVVSWVSLSGLNTNGIILNIDATLKKNMNNQYPINVISYEGNDINENDVEIVIDNGEVPTIYAENMTGKQGDAFELPLKIINNPGLSALGIKIEYDKSVLTLNDVTDSALLTNTYFEHGDFNKTPITLNWTGISNISENGELAKLKFTINDSVADTDTTVRIVVVECVNSDETDVPLYGENSIISIKNVTAPKEYEVIFKNWNGDELQKTNFKEGETPAYQGVIPTREEDNTGKYKFTGWSPSIEPVTKEQVYTAQFDIIEKYTITYETSGGVINDDSYPEKYFKGEGATLPTDITKADNVFVGWFDNKQLTGEAVTTITTNDTGNKKYYAKWMQGTPSEYLITFINWDNSELQKSNVAVGTKPVYNGTKPEKPADEKYTYEFDGWTPAVKAVNGIATYKATFKKMMKPLIDVYSVECIDDDGVRLIVSPLKFVIQNLNLYRAIYNGDKTLKSVEVIKCSLNDDGDIIVPLTKPNIGANESYKLMLWDKQQAPIINAISSSDDFFEK